MEALIALYRAPHNRRSVQDPTSVGVRKNPLCGDEISIELRVVGETIDDVAFRGRGCSIAVASASLLTDCVRGLDRTEAGRVAESLSAMLDGALVADLPPVLEPLRDVARFPMRHSCARMPWHALRSALGHD